MTAPVTIDAKPGPLQIDPARTAVIVVDMQNDFGHEHGMFARRGIDVTLIRQAIEPTRAVLTAARKAGAKVVFLKMEFDPELSNVGLPDLPNRIKHRSLKIGERIAAPDGTEGRILIKDTWNTQILDELRPEPQDLIVSKHRYSGFYGTNLDETLRSFGITHLVFTGCTTSVCVESTMRDAMFRDYYCLLLADCTAEPIGANLPRTNHDASLLVLQTQFGWVSESATFVRALQDRRVQPRGERATSSASELRPKAGSSSLY